MGKHGVIQRYREHMPALRDESIITLHEGSTPLIRAHSTERQIGQDLKIYLKYDGLNPTGSFKDRGMTMAISKAVDEGAQAVICASTGNTAASAAAYAARAGIKCYVLVPKGNVAMGKLAQSMMHGAVVLQIDGLFDLALEIVRDLAELHKITLVNSVNPYRIEGQKSAAFEICDELGDAPDFHALPVGNAGNITAYWKGFNEYCHCKNITKLPKVVGFQAAGSSPIVNDEVVENPETIATAIKIGNPASWKTATAARDESGGRIEAVNDDEILQAYKLLSSREGVFCEPASAASVAGVMKLAAENYFPAKSIITCTLTGHGLKDPERAIESSTKPIQVRADMQEILKVINL
jgi:threonine synthase